MSSLLALVHLQKLFCLSLYVLVTFHILYYRQKPLNFHPICKLVKLLCFIAFALIEMLHADKFVVNQDFQCFKNINLYCIRLFFVIFKSLAQNIKKIKFLIFVCQVDRYFLHIHCPCLSAWTWIFVYFRVLGYTYYVPTYIIFRWLFELLLLLWQKMVKLHTLKEHINVSFLTAQQKVWNY